MAGPARSAWDRSAASDPEPSWLGDVARPIIASPALAEQSGETGCELRLAGVDVLSTSAAELPVVSAILSEQERRRASRFVDQRDRDAYVMGHYLLRQLLGHATRSAPQRLVFARRACPTCGRPGAKPYLAGAPGVEFSLSHTRGRVVVAVASLPVGVDVQACVPGVVFTASSSFAEDERRQIRDLPHGERGTASIRCWARKEAALKASGQGVAHGIARPVVGAGDSPLQPPGWWIRDLDVGIGYACAFAVSTRGESH